MRENKQVVPFGLWPSPISPTLLGQRVRLEGVQWDSDGQTLIWLEGRSDRGVLVALPRDEARRDLTDEQMVRGGVGYGGGEFGVAHGQLFFVERNGRIYRRALAHGRPRPITPAFGACAAPTPSPDGKWLVYVYSDGHDDLLALVDSDGREWPVKLAVGADFYMQPAWHPAGDRLAWIEWDHPNMPWDGSRLMLGRLTGDSPRLVEVHQVDGGPNFPVAQPNFSPDGRWLSYIAGRGEWEQLMLLDLNSGISHTLVEGQGFHLTIPAWVQGVRTCGWNATSQRIYYLRNADSAMSLWWVDLSSGESTQVDLGAYSYFHQLAVSPVDEQLALVASAPNQPDRVLRWDGQVHIAARSETESLEAEYFSIPQAITWEAPDGTRVHGLFSPPQNPKFTAAGLPPAILNVHGGPTSQAWMRYSGEAAYFTSRGYAWLEINYRGSSGYGRTYRDLLRNSWGLVDREDAVGAAQALAEQGLADPARLVIKGGSAGGYTVLNALIHYPGRFKAGLCSYGVSNLFTLAMDTHKLEAHYNDFLVGVLPEAAGRYHAFSPTFHLQSIRDALAVFQGDSDPVVPPAQSEEIVAALRQNGVPHIYRLYPGEGHGFRKSETIVDYFQQTERFLQQHVLFAP